VQPEGGATQGNFDHGRVYIIAEEVVAYLSCVAIGRTTARKPQMLEARATQILYGAERTRCQHLKMTAH